MSVGYTKAHIHHANCLPYLQRKGKVVAHILPIKTTSRRLRKKDDAKGKKPRVSTTKSVVFMLLSHNV